ncbi:hypothetical protein DTO013E5_9231 [Penicillium roqueforti]|uniref:Genomic scaffold, ProqFM164S04 n=1 Tax=Penicillium roqueforti (strain FM164) TaxID=1365484 RepID=W6QIG7_PENRF|nr:uncharacterized protein LCP9604111_8947 [Penicillium roqueforti]CDM35786.1 unnamed protein product [Penicillium roqueforti FM164]KAF9239927.1 hypothetical protein LCP9604111_8947 [Penicillium roqueforti]KAI1831401.1 hypothetical protein CBS147337_7867 [Penicillium roqueforti]KAI2671391.1 hypothetical protein CBS147355_8673 [Penicillium roqueforti]KAI2672901.1 hypothetical protein LCP963914a_9231 [Penicillium roqueforti]
MKFLTCLLMLATSAIAAPITNTTKVSKQFHLKSSGATNANHNNLYVYSYHTGAGLSDAVLTSDVSIASPIYLNGTNAVVDLKTEFSWGLIATGDTNYASWEPIVINAGSGGSAGYSIKGDAFQWSENNGFGGWLVCDWYHNAPQLFYLNRYYTATIPSSCSKVQLTTEYI